MILTGTGESGVEEWVCPTCGRRMLLRWPPYYEKFILEQGDDAAIHVGGKGGLRVGPAPVGEAPLGEAPVGEAAVGDAPIGGAPLGDAPLGDAPVAEVPEAERQWLRANGIDWDGAPA